MVTSGIRIGTPAVTSRGLGVAEMEIVGRLIAEKLSSPEDSAVHERIFKQVHELCDRFPLYRSEDELVRAK